MAELIDRGANNIRERHSDWNSEQLTRWLYKSALCREPTAEELAVAKGIIGDPPTDERVADFLWTVFMLPEFQLVR